MRRFSSQHCSRPDSPSATYPPRHASPQPSRGNYAPSLSSHSDLTDALTHSTPCPSGIPRTAHHDGTAHDILDTPCKATPRAADVALTLEEQLMLLGLHPDSGTAAWFVSLWHVQQWPDDDQSDTETDVTRRTAEAAIDVEDEEGVVADAPATSSAALRCSMNSGHLCSSPTPAHRSDDEVGQAQGSDGTAKMEIKRQRRLSSNRGDLATRGQEQLQHSARSQLRTAPAIRLTPVDLVSSAHHGRCASSRVASSSTSSSPPLPLTELGSEPRRRRQVRQTLEPLPGVPSAATAPVEAPRGAEEEAQHEDAARSSVYTHQRLLGPLTSAQGATAARATSAMLAEGRRTVVVISLGSISELRQKVISERIAQATRHTVPAASGAEAPLLDRPAHYFDVGSLVRARGRQQRLPPLRTVPLQ